MGVVTFIGGILFAILIHQKPQIVLSTENLSQTNTVSKIATTSIRTLIQHPEDAPISKTPQIEVAGTATKENVPVLPEQKQITVILKLPDFTESITIPEESSVYKLLEVAKKERGLLFTTKSYPVLGFLIDSIGGIRGGDKAGFYWIYSVNNKRAIVGISNYILKNGDVVEWKYESEN